MSKLLPCPFCGSHEVEADGWSSTETSGPACSKCQGSAGGTSWSPEQNIAAWNTRAGASDRAEIARLREALEPFASCAPIFDHGSSTRPSADNDAIMSWNDHRVEGERGFTVGDLRRARAALEPKP